jgi:hypothetical protein
MVVGVDEVDMVRQPANHENGYNHAKHHNHLRIFKNLQKFQSTIYRLDFEIKKTRKGNQKP